MGRENCITCSFLGDDAYCDYFDVFFMKCQDMSDCPDGLDYDEDCYDDDEDCDW